MSGPLRTIVSILASPEVERALLDEFADRVEPYGGVPVERPGTAAFESPADAVRFAVAVRGSGVASPTEVRAGIDLGAVEGGDAASSVANALADYAASGEILVTDVVRRLAGSLSGSHYVDRGRVRPPGLDERHQLHAVVTGNDDAVGPAFGRDSEVAAVRTTLTDVAGGDGRCILLEGAAGIGKTHLVRTGVSLAEDLGLTVVEGRADELGMGPGLLPTLAAALDVRGAGERSGGDPAYPLIEAVVVEIEQLAVDRPVLVVAEDAHWADDTSVRVLAAIASATTAAPICLLIAARPSPRTPALGRCIDHLARTSCEHLRLAHLDPASIEGLATARLGAVPGPALRERLAATDGNPLFVLELIRALEDEGALRIERGVAHVPAIEMVERGDRSVQSTVDRRLRALPAGTRDALQLASLLGTSFTLVDLSTIASQRIVDVATTLRPALDADLVEGQGDQLRFQHDLVREAVHLGIPPAIRRDLHAAAGRALAAVGAPADTVARQFGAGARSGDELAIEWLTRAAEESLAVDTRAAVEHYERVLTLLPTSDQTRRDRTEAVLVELLAWSGRVEEAKRTADELLARSLSDEDALAAHRARAAALASSGDLRGAAVACRSALQTDPSAVDAAVLRCAAAGMDVLTGGEVGEAIEVATAVAGGPDREPVCWAEQTLGIAALAEARHQDAHHHFGRSRALLDAVALPPLGFLLPHTWEAAALAYMDRFDDSLAAAEDARRRAEARGDLGMLVQAHVLVGLVRYLAGQWDEAVAELAALQRIAAETAAEPHRIATHAALAAIRFDRGEPDAARSHLEQGRSVLESGGGHLFGAELLAWSAARVVEADGEPRSALAVMDMIWPEIAPVIHVLRSDLVLPMLVRLRRAMGDSAGATEIASVAAAGDRGESATSRALALHCRGLADDDVDALLRAVELARRSPRRLYRVTLAEAAIPVLQAAGRDRDAAAVLAEAMDDLEVMGATAWIDRMVTERDVDPARLSRPRPTHGWDSLSPKEHEVVGLVAEGLSNPQIAEQLFISRRTVESHLSHVFRKLDVSNRTQLARQCLDRRSAPPLDTFSS